MKKAIIDVRNEMIYFVFKKELYYISISDNDEWNTFTDEYGVPWNTQYYLNKDTDFPSFSVWNCVKDENGEWGMGEKEYYFDDVVVINGHNHSFSRE